METHWLRRAVSPLHHELLGSNNEDRVASFTCFNHRLRVRSQQGRKKALSSSIEEKKTHWLKRAKVLSTTKPSLSKVMTCKGIQVHRDNSALSLLPVQVQDAEVRTSQLQEDLEANKDELQSLQKEEAAAHRSLGSMKDLLAAGLGEVRDACS
eukprot:1143544-Pelagomonas_calceolata.AAC.1